MIEFTSFYPENDSFDHLQELSDEKHRGGEPNDALTVMSAADWLVRSENFLPGLKGLVYQGLRLVRFGNFGPR